MPYKSTTYVIVSTHSRLKAAGDDWDKMRAAYTCFNTQPPKGGWLSKNMTEEEFKEFQHTAA